jgi:hypothetical protein
MIGGCISVVTGPSGERQQLDHCIVRDALDGAHVAVIGHELSRAITSYHELSRASAPDRVSRRVNDGDDSHRERISHVPEPPREEGFSRARILHVRVGGHRRNADSGPTS